MNLEILGAESLGVRSLCCRVTLPGRCLVIDPGVSLGYLRSGLLPHPLQIAVGRRVRNRILQALSHATDIVFSHFHGDHVPLLNANPYQLAFRQLPPGFGRLCCWSKSDDDLSGNMRKRFEDLSELMGPNLHAAEGRSAGSLSFSRAVPHGARESNRGTVMMTRVDANQRVFVHASDIQLLDEGAVRQVIDWRPDIVLAAGPPLYLNRLSPGDEERACRNALRIAEKVDIVILDHHLMRSRQGARWLDELSHKAGKKIYCAADFMGLPRRLLEAKRDILYERFPVAGGWHARYAGDSSVLDAALDAPEIEKANFEKERFPKAAKPGIRVPEE